MKPAKPRKIAPARVKERAELAAMSAILVDKTGKELYNGVDEWRRRHPGKEGGK